MHIGLLFFQGIKMQEILGGLDFKICHGVEAMPPDLLAPHAYHRSPPSLSQFSWICP